MAVVEASSYSSDLTPSVGTSICLRCGPKKTTNKQTKDLKIELPYDPAISLLGKYLEKSIIQQDTCIPTFTAILFTIA